MNNLSEDLKKVLLAGLGAMAVTAEKSKEVVEQLVKKGELTVEQGKVLNEELKHTVAEKLREPVNAEKVSQDLEKLDPSELEKLKAKIEELQSLKNESE
ncbi:phasin family protein [Candidatus Stoquefichus massiliensis]|uniref:phasin family protein n=1 Tax=Candidatus Stoquefichus massiliensis TaxID=1470350 RepID=UPI0004875BE6|nr:phasin family protein [Candidatus Stoquefichus massiliensis]